MTLCRRQITAFSIDSLEYNEINLNNAIKYIDTLHAGGGTEILDPIRFALYEHSDDRVILLFTDGQVGNEEEICKFVSKNIGKSRLFPFGIDTSINTSFIRNLAKAGNGKAEFVHPNEKIDEKVIRTFARIQSPLVENLRIDYGKNKVVDEIKEDNILFNYEFYNTMVKLEKLVDDIYLRGSILGKDFEWKISKEEIVESNINLELIFEKLHINKIEEYMEIMPHRDRDIYEKMIIDISTKHNIVTKYTTFIGTYERENKLFEIPVVQNIVLSNCYAEMCMCDRSVEIPTFLRKNKNIYRNSTMPPILNSQDDNLEKLKNYFEDNRIEKIDTYLLFAVCFKRHGNDLISDEDLLVFLKNNSEDIKSNEEHMELLYMLYMASNEKIRKYIYENLFGMNYRKIVDTRIKYVPNLKLKKIKGRALKTSLNNLTEDNINDVIWSLV